MQGCYFLACLIFVAGLGRDYMYGQGPRSSTSAATLTPQCSFSLALAEQPQVQELGAFHFEIAAHVLSTAPACPLALA